jgi:type VI secretion system protein ImpJ
MTANAVYWYEGMFLQPHHLQAAERHQAYVTQLGSKWDLHHNWGLRSVELREDALANHRLVIRRLEARLQDGTLVVVRPDDGALPALDLKAALERDPAVKVFLAVPVLRLGRANVCESSDGDDGRYTLDTQEIEDENNGVNQEAVQFRRLNLKLILSATDEHPGYEVLPIARVEKSAEADAPPRLDNNYIPPVLACDAWETLRVDILQNIYERVGMKIELLANLAETRGVAVDSQAGGDALMIGQLRALNEAYALLGGLVFARGVHPMQAYLELCRLVGQLAIFSRERRPPKLPAYDHDDLGGCFWRVKQHLDGLMDLVFEPEYKTRPFEGVGLRIQVPLEAGWLESSWQVFVGVKTSLPVEECVNLLTQSGQLGMKIGSSDRVDAIHRHGSAGLRFAHAPRPPSALPSAPGLIYFQVSRDAQPEEWRNVQKSLSLAARLNETRIEGNIQGEKVFTVRANGQTTKLQFTLYVVKAGKSTSEPRPSGSGAAGAPLPDGRGSDEFVTR